MSRFDNRSQSKKHPIHTASSIQPPSDRSQTEKGESKEESTTYERAGDSSAPVYRNWPGQQTHRPTLLDELGEGRQTAAITFAGQGAWDLDSFALWYRKNPTVRKFVDAAAVRLEEVLQERELRWSGRYEQGFDIKSWLLEPSSRPSASYLRASSVSQPLIFMNQIACYQSMWEEGLKQAFSAGSIRSTTGHSQGIMPAMLVGESQSGELSLERYLDYLVYMCWQGWWMAQSYEEIAPPAKPGEATCMAAVSGLSSGELQIAVGLLNEHLPELTPVTISLSNTRLRHVLSGTPESLERLRQGLEQRATKEAKRKKEGRWGGKPLSFVWEYLQVTVAFHSPFMQQGLEQMRERVALMGFKIPTSALQLDVISPDSGVNYKDSEDPLELVMKDQFIHPVLWQSTIQHIAKSGVDIVLDCGPGDGVARLSYSVLKGTGVRVIPMATTAGREALQVKALEELPRPLRYDAFKPRLRTNTEGEVVLENRYTQATGHSPMVLPGMTPTTADVDLVAAAANAGHTAELAGGGQVTEEMFWLRMEELQEKLEPGREVVFNALYLDPYLWNLHFRQKGLVQKARQAGFPLCGVTISAGIPEIEEATVLLREFYDLGLWLNAFKPGTVAQVKQIVKIAQTVPDMTLFMHLEGGKAGGHHSWEDLDALLLDTYHMVREQPNLVLCVGGGIGTEKRAADLLSGSWSQQYGLLEMPVDAVLLGTVTMACKEAKTSPQVKQALVDAAGSNDWVFAGDVKGSITSGKSALNADIHYIDNPASRCGRLLDEVAGDAEAVAARYDEIVEALNATAKPYFGNLSDMTVLEVAQQMMEWMAVGNHSRYEDGCWPDVSYRQRWADFLRRAEARLTEQQEGTFPSFLANLSQLDNPPAVLEAFVAKYPQAAKRPMHPSDCKHFVDSICARPGKPVNFVPVIDADVRRWYKSDSLWQTHDDRFEADQVLIIPGPQAVGGLKQVDEPVAQLLGRFNAHLKQHLESTPDSWVQDSNESHGFWHNVPSGMDVRMEGSTLTLSVQQPSNAQEWFTFLHETFVGPIASLFKTHRVMVGNRSYPNPVWKLLKAEPEARLSLVRSQTQQVESLTYIPANAAGDENVQLTWLEEQRCVRMDVTIPSLPGQEQPALYRLMMQVHGSVEHPVYHIEEQSQRDAIRDFYHKALFGGHLEPAPLFATVEEEVSLSAEQIRGYLAVTGGPLSSKNVPLNMVFSAAWKPLFRALSSDEIVADILNLVHLHNHVTPLEGWPICADETVTVQSCITRLEDTAAGRIAHTESRVLRGTTPCAVVDSAFFIRGSFHRTPWSIRAKETLRETTKVTTLAEADFLATHSWLEDLQVESIQPGHALVWDVVLNEQQPKHGQTHFVAHGTVTSDDKVIAQIALDETSEAKLHPVRALLETLGTEKPNRHDVTRRTLARATTQNPHNMDTFSEVSWDSNPIHRSTLAARLGGLEEPIVQGMWTAARLSHFLLQHVAHNRPSLLQDYKAEFLAPSLLGETLVMEAVRTGVQDGDMWIEATASVVREEQQVPVVRATARIAAPRTAYIFPGQGIQQKGMGMAGYGRSKAVRQVWDRADAYTRNNLGFSILKIVRNNPQELNVQGTLQLHPKGVLHLTQFTQVAMAVLAHAQVTELKEAGVYRPDAVICGHSVGEYNALAVTEVLPLEAVVDLVYQRGLVMHSLVARDEHGQSGYGMAVVRPHYAKMNHAEAEALVQAIAQDTGQFLQIVNYNVRGRQYSVTGKLEALRALEQKLDEYTQGTKPAYIEVPGIDVPFHSTMLRDGVAQFRETLDARLPASIDHRPLLGRYIPNLVPHPFTLERSYLEDVASYTESSILIEVLEDWATWEQKPSALARLLLIELLAWQFASPVRWIETQDLWFQPQASGGMELEQIIEIGVGYQPTLANMARYSHKLLGPTAPELSIVNVEAEADLVFYKDEDEELPPVIEASPEPQQTENQAPVAPDASTVPVAPQPVSAGPVEDRPALPSDALRILLALQAKVRWEQLRDDDTIDELFDGVSSRRNQALLDLGAELNMGPIDGAHEKPLHTLADEVNKRASSYKAPGKYLKAVQDESLKRVFGRAGLGRKEIQGILADEYGLGEGLSTFVFNAITLTTRDGQSKRGELLGKFGSSTPSNKNEAKDLLDKIVTLVGQTLQLPLARRTQQSVTGAAVDAAVVRELEDRILGPQGVLMNNARQLAQALGHKLDEGPGLPEKDEQAERLALWEAEHGAEYESMIQPRFDAQKHVAFTSSWAWAQRDLAALYYDTCNQQITLQEAQQSLHRLVSFAREERVANTARWFAQKSRKAGQLELAILFTNVAEGQSWEQAPIVPSRPSLGVNEDGSLNYKEVEQLEASAYSSFVEEMVGAKESARLQLGMEGSWNESFHQLLKEANQSALDFRGETALVTGASPGSIAVMSVRHLLRGGARVIVTTTTYNPSRLRYYRDLYEAEATPGAELHVVPFNQSSFQDGEALIQWLFGTVTEQNGAGVRVLKRPFAPSLFLPFAAVKDLATLDSLGARSNIVIRAMLLSVERMIGAIATHYNQNGSPLQPCHVVLPLSPNHGSFGGDGVYAETKAAMEVLLQKWSSEHDAWGKAITFCAARIGWVRGTGLMDANNPVAARLEEQTGVRTFSSPEMGWLLTALCLQAARNEALQAPLEADLTGGFGQVTNLRETVEGIRQDIDDQAQRMRNKQTLLQQEAEALGHQQASNEAIHALPNWPIASAETKASSTPWPSTPASMDLSKAVVIVGMGELGPCGTSRTRFELEVDGKLSPAGVLELAWMTGLIHFDNNSRVGVWKDTETGDEVSESKIAARYYEAVQKRVGIRMTEPETSGFDPSATPILTSVFLEQDFTFPVTSAEEAQSFVKAEPDSTRASYDAESDSWRVTRLAGSEIRVPRQAKLSRRVAGQIPTGFDFSRYGIPQDMIDSVDRVSLFNLIATVDAFVSAGLSPEELMRWVHPARVANTQGSGIGGMQSIKRLYLDHLLGKERQNDALQETLINVVAAYVVQSYVGSYGSMSHPVAACATAAVSLEDGMDKILAGKADFVVTGGYDDIGEEGVIGFGDMNATADTDKMVSMGLEPSQMSRANDTRRRGFLEAQGGGTILLARGDVAARMGLPVEGVLAYASSFGDGIHKSIPAPGMGALSCAMGGSNSPLAQALQQYGLTTDDIALVYKHDTSTGANDPNENQLHHRIQETLGRTEGNPLFVVSQKTLTGHPKGGAAAWQLVGLCQSLQQGVIPGNRNLDCVDDAMQPYTHMTFTNRSLQTDTSSPTRAGLMTSLGFGHVSGLALVVHPDAFLSLLSEEERTTYLERSQQRRRQANNDWASILLGEKQAYQKRTERRFEAADGTSDQADEEATLLLHEDSRFHPQHGRYGLPQSDMGIQ